MKTRILQAATLAALSLLAATPTAALAHGGGHSGGGGGGHGGGGSWHGGGAWHGGGYSHHGGYYRWYGGGPIYYGGYDNPWWGLPADGYSDWDYPSTSGTAVYESPPARTTNSGSSLISDVQASLARTGYYRSNIDGRLGPATRNAIGQYQADHRLPVTHRIDEALLQSLGLI